MATNNDGRPSVFAKYIDDTLEKEKERLKAFKQQRKNIKSITRGAQEANVRDFLLNALANGPVPAAIIAELGKARKFSTNQLWHAKQQIGAGSFKTKGKFDGCWFWVAAQHPPEQTTTTKPDERYTRRLRNLSKMLGFRLRPIGKYPRNKRSA